MLTKPVPTRDHAKLTNIGTNTHAQIDTHLALTPLNAHGSTASSDINMAGFKAVALTCDNGATLPSSPVSGQWFLHTPTGRKVLMMYDGSAWQPIWNNGAATMYVDPTGTDSQNNGGATGTGAFLTIQFAVNQIAGLVGGNVTINVAAGTYAESPSVMGKAYTGSYNITFYGTFAQQRATTTVSSATAGSGSANATLTVNGASLTTDQYKAMILRFADDATTVALRGEKYLVLENNNAANSVITILGGWVAAYGTTPSATDTFTIERPGTIVTGEFSLPSGQKEIYVEKFRFQDRVNNKNWSSLFLTDCEIESKQAAKSACEIFVFSLSTLTRCYYDINHNCRGLYIAEYARVHTYKCLFNGAGITNTNLVDVSAAKLNLIHTTAIEGNGGTGRALMVNGNSVFGAFISTSQQTRHLIRNNATGIRAETGGQAASTSATYVVYSGNTTDTSADTASYGYIS